MPMPALIRSREREHFYETCSDDDCPRFPCRVYKEGYVRGYLDGMAAGEAAGYAEGYSQGAADAARS